MFLTDFEINNIKCFEDAHLNFAHSQDDYSGWNVILGGNGTGKSTLLQAMALTLVGPLLGQRLLYNPAGWTRKPAKHGEIRAKIAPGKHDTSMGQPRKKPYQAAFAITGSETVELEGNSYDQPQLVQLKEDHIGLSKGPYAVHRPGWLACGYGPFRRMTGMGGSEEYDLVYSSGRGKRFATLFREGAAITNCTEWLVSLYGRSVDPHQADGEKLKNDLALLQNVINALLPGAVQITRIDSKGVYFHTIGGIEVTVPELSDGYRSFLALAIDLLRQIHESIDDFSDVIERIDDHVAVTMEGVVLIDEVDAHLHPLWQREISFRLCKAFPRIQFIVTSHSPFVAQAANDHGLFVLRKPEGKESVIAIQPVKSARGWRVDQVLTDRFLFDLESTRDKETETLMQRHAELVSKREWNQLSPAEKKELIDLEKSLAERLTAPGENAAELQRRTAMDAYVNETLVKLSGVRNDPAASPR